MRFVPDLLYALAGIYAAIALDALVVRAELPFLLCLACLAWILLFVNAMREDLP